MMDSDYSEALWQHIVNGCRPWTAKSPFLGKKKSLRTLRISTKAVLGLVGSGPTMA